MSEIKKTLTEEQKEEIEDLYGHLDPEYQIKAVGYMYGLEYQDAKKRMSEFSEEEIANSIDYYDLDGFNPLKKNEFYEQKQTSRKEIEETYGLSPLRAMCARDRLTFDRGLDSIQTEAGMENGQ